MPVPRRGERGSAVVDFVMVVVVLVPLFLGILQIALVLHVRNVLAAAAAEGARAAAVAGGTPEDGLRTVREQVAGAIAGEYAGRARVENLPVGGTPGVVVTIPAEVPTLGLGGPAVRLEVTGHAVREQ